MSKVEIQAWVDDRFGVPNTFNIQLLLDFQKAIIKKWKEERDAQNSLD
jgi:hypothetical protein